MAEGLGTTEAQIPERPHRKVADMVILWWMTDSILNGEEITPAQREKIDQIMQIIDAIGSTPEHPIFPSDKQLAEIAKNIGYDLDEIIDRTVDYGPGGVTLDQTGHMKAA